jgi:hypothetical protein
MEFTIIYRMNFTVYGGNRREEGAEAWSHIVAVAKRGNHGKAPGHFQ